MANSADPDQLGSSEANWSGSTLFAKAGYIRVQQDYSVKKISLNICFLELMEEFLWDLKNRFKSAMENKPSVFRVIEVQL